MKKYMCFVAFCLFGVSLIAQPYHNAIGVRLGKQYGISFQQKIIKNFTVEGLFHYDFRNKSSISVVGKQYKKIILPNLNYFYGAGLHKGWIKDNVITEEGAKVGDETSTKDPFGITGVAGLEMTVGRLNFGIDYRPNINITGGGGLLDHNTAFSIRYVIAKDKQPFKSNKKKKGKKSNKKPMLGKKR